MVLHSGKRYRKSIVLCGSTLHSNSATEPDDIGRAETCSILQYNKMSETCGEPNGWVNESVLP